ncbi:MAG: hypothetical protein JNJ58_14505 [Chitinophagaceae bacterium]|nr:hypothetical protein [Chitinophagaceae bacterium]
MKSLYILLIILCHALNSQAQTQNEYIIDYKDPSSVVNAIFEAAKTGRFILLAGLCDPMRENDGDTRRLCAISDYSDHPELYGGLAQTKKQKKEFTMAFSKGRITGPVTIHQKEGGLQAAEVPIEFSRYADKPAIPETMWLINRNGNWYLGSF